MNFVQLTNYNAINRWTVDLNFECHQTLHIPSFFWPPNQSRIDDMSYGFFVHRTTSKLSVFVTRLRVKFMCIYWKMTFSFSENIKWNMTQNFNFHQMFEQFSVSVCEYGVNTKLFSSHLQKKKKEKKQSKKRNKIEITQIKKNKRTIQQIHLSFRLYFKFYFTLFKS